MIPMTYHRVSAGAVTVVVSITDVALWRLVNDGYIYVLSHCLYTSVVNHSDANKVLQLAQVATANHAAFQRTTRIWAWKHELFLRLDVQYHLQISLQVYNQIESTQHSDFGYLIVTIAILNQLLTAGYWFWRVQLLTQQQLWLPRSHGSHVGDQHPMPTASRESLWWCCGSRKGWSANMALSIRGGGHQVWPFIVRKPSIIGVCRGTPWSPWPWTNPNGCFFPERITKGGHPTANWKSAWVLLGACWDGVGPGIARSHELTLKVLLGQIPSII